MTSRSTHFSVLWPGAVSVCVAIAACGGGDDGENGGAGGSTATAGGSAGSAGSGSNAGGASGSGSSSGGSSAGGSSGASSAGSGGTGPTCTPRDEVPDPVPRTTDVQTICRAPEPCGGALSDTSWEVESVCVDRDALFPGLLGVCSAVSTIAVIPSRPVGTATFDDAGEADVALEVDVSVFADFPNGCHGCQCATLEAQLDSAGIDASCNPVCNGGSCTCSLHATVSLTYSGSYAAAGEELELGSEALPYCVDGETLTFSDGGSVYTLRPPEVLRTPEICDGIDNDGNGVVDDDPVECPSCSNVGACGEGVIATCNGSGGWSCEYTSPSWEASETLCDAIDNDCDGSVNEDLDCKELCDGIDNDASGVVDDGAFGAPSCTSVGVCASGYQAECNGAEGYACVAASPDFEPVETTCDGLDNDCDGSIDERCCAAGSAKMYYAYIDSDRTGAFVARADLNGQNAENLVEIELATLLDVAIDPVGDKIYWANISQNVIQRSNLDGSNVETPLTASTQPRLALDVARRFLFWSTGSSLVRTNLDDLGQSETLTGVPAPRAITVDSQHGWLFMGSGNLIHRVGIDGSDRITIGEDLDAIGQVISGIAVDPVSAKVYWTSTGGLHRANLDLSEPEQVMALSTPHQLFIDAAARRFYWSETVSPQIGFMDFDSSPPSYFAPGVATIRFGEVVHCPP